MFVFAMPYIYCIKLFWVMMRRIRTIAQLYFVGLFVQKKYRRWFLTRNFSDQGCVMFHELSVVTMTRPNPSCYTVCGIPAESSSQSNQSIFTAVWQNDADNPHFIIRKSIHTYIHIKKDNIIYSISFLQVNPFSNFHANV